MGFKSTGLIRPELMAAASHASLSGGWEGEEQHDSFNRHHNCSTKNTKQYCRKQCSQKHVKLALAFAQACQTTRGEMQCAYYN